MSLNSDPGLFSISTGYVLDVVCSHARFYRILASDRDLTLVRNPILYRPKFNSMRTDTVLKILRPELSNRVLLDVPTESTLVKPKRIRLYLAGRAEVSDLCQQGRRLIGARKST
ncbi:hypothetical protein EVAR_11542_1 [Eumeta japonica]|uniref:Uncharacterized protein n=1 Tax=Eumeta variegata TaxID=151549 RepID=A0A4C1TYT5_EUMVA|nr:hypothetical protein EVAR_11542_1 [Eumeta japonica]